jgi:hypothetical protein
MIHTRYRKICAAVLAALFASIGGVLLHPDIAHAWDATGHETVARIAWERLTPAARARALRLLHAAPADADLRTLFDSTQPKPAQDRELFVRAATWPDVIKDRAQAARYAKYNHSAWHYRDGYWQQDTPGGPIIDRPEIDPDPKGENAVAALVASEAGLRNGSRADSLKAIDLIWVMHLVGDVHQPLHASSRITPEDRGGDQGGNRFRFGAATNAGNLHSFWDNTISRDFPRRTADVTLDAYITRVATSLMSAHPAHQFNGQLAPADFDAWTRTSLGTTKRDLYPVTLVRDQQPPAAYATLAAQIADPAVALAGYRLGELLNTLLK